MEQDRVDERDLNSVFNLLFSLFPTEQLFSFLLKVFSLKVFVSIFEMFSVFSVFWDRAIFSCFFLCRNLKNTAPEGWKPIFITSLASAYVALVLKNNRCDRDGHGR